MIILISYLHQDVTTLHYVYEKVFLKPQNMHFFSLSFNFTQNSFFIELCRLLHIEELSLHTHTSHRSVSDIIYRLKFVGIVAMTVDNYMKL